MQISEGRTFVTQKLGLPLGGCQVKRHNQAKEQEKEGFIICSKLGDHQGSFPKQQTWGSFKLRVHAYS